MFVERVCCVHGFGGELWVWVDAGGEVGGCVIIDSCLWSRPARDLSSSTRLGEGVWESFGNHLGSFGYHLGII